MNPSYESGTVVEFDEIWLFVLKYSFALYGIWEQFLAPIPLLVKQLVDHANIESPVTLTEKLL